MSGRLTLRNAQALLMPYSRHTTKFVKYVATVVICNFLYLGYRIRILQLLCLKLVMVLPALGKLLKFDTVCDAYL